MLEHKVIFQDNMRCDFNVDLPMSDGLNLKADIYRPLGDGKYPVLLSMGPYGKGLAFQDGYYTAWNQMIRDFPEIEEKSSNKYQSWEVADPEVWIPYGYALVRVDSRGAGCSPGIIKFRDERETQDLCEAIDWAGTQDWCNGKVGLCGISYFAVVQWNAASRDNIPSHLAAICPWEGYTDYYRDCNYHGGIRNTWHMDWYRKQVRSVQYGLGKNGPVSRVTGDPVCGDVTLSDEELKANCLELDKALRDHPFDGDFYRERSADLHKIKVPFLSGVSWGGNCLHQRGGINPYYFAPIEDKWLEFHGLEHWTHFYTNYGCELQKRFFDYFLKGEDNGWDKQPKVQMNVRYVDRFELRYEEDWPIPRTQWTKYYLQPDGGFAPKLPEKDSAIEFEALGDGLTFLTEPFEQETEVSGPLVAKLFASTSTTDMDLFLVLRLFSPDLHEVTFIGSTDPHTPLAQGWLRASHRKKDESMCLPWQPYYAHDELLPVIPDEKLELDIDFWTTCVVIPKGYRLGVSIRGKDYEWSKENVTIRLNNFAHVLNGNGPHSHNDPEDRPKEIYGGKTTIHISKDQAPYIQLPVIPPLK